MGFSRETVNEEQNLVGWIGVTRSLF